MTVGDLLARASSRELSEWRAFFKVEKSLRDDEEPKPLPVDDKIKTELTGYKKR